MLPDCFSAMVVPFSFLTHSLDDFCFLFLATLNRHNFCQPNYMKFYVAIFMTIILNFFLCVWFFFLWKLPVSCLFSIFLLELFVLLICDSLQSLEKDDLGHLRVLSLCAIWLPFHFIYNVFSYTYFELYQSCLCWFLLNYILFSSKNHTLLFSYLST